MVRLLPCFVVVAPALLCLSTITPTFASDEQITLQQITAKVANWRGSFVNIHVVYELRSLPAQNEPLVNWPPPTDTESAPKFAQVEWIWADHGLDLLDSRAFYWSPGKVGFRDIDCFNNPKKLVETKILGERIMRASAICFAMSCLSAIISGGLAIAQSNYFCFATPGLACHTGCGCPIANNQNDFCSGALPIVGN
jgi:hypothetical protein